MNEYLRPSTSGCCCPSKTCLVTVSMMPLRTRQSARCRGARFMAGGQVACSLPAFVGQSQELQQILCSGSLSLSSFLRYSCRTCLLLLLHMYSRTHMRRNRHTLNLFLPHSSPLSALPCTDKSSISWNPVEGCDRVTSLSTRCTSVRCVCERVREKEKERESMCADTVFLHFHSLV